jgi:hypothetical protein
MKCATRNRCSIVLHYFNVQLQQVYNTSCTLCKKYATCNQYSICVVLFTSNIQLQPVSDTRCTFIRVCSQEMWNSNRYSVWVALFHKKCVTLTNIRHELHFFTRNMKLATGFIYDLHFSHEMCNSNRFSIQIILFSRNMQLAIGFRNKLHFSPYKSQCSQEMYNSNRYLVRVALFHKECATLTSLQYELHFFTWNVQL